MWYPGLGVVLDCIDSKSLPPFLLQWLEPRGPAEPSYLELQCLLRQDTLLHKMKIQANPFHSGYR